MAVNEEVKLAFKAEMNSLLKVIQMADEKINAIGKNRTQFGLYTDKEAQADMARLEMIKRNAIAAYEILKGRGFTPLPANYLSNLQRLKNELAEATRKTKELEEASKRTSSGFKGWAADVLKFGAAFGLGTSAVDLFRGAIGTLTGTVRTAFETMDQLRMSTASIAGAMMTNNPGMTFAEGWGRANAVITKTYELTGKFIGSARELQILAESMSTFGYKIDLRTKKSQDEFINFANILKIITAGQNFEIQAFQELRALDQGQNFQGAMLARRLQSVGVSDVRAQVQAWKEQGVFLEKINELLGGYAQMSKVIAQNVDAQKKSTKALVDLTLASGLEEFWKDVSKALQDVNKWFAGDGSNKSGVKIFAEQLQEAYEVVKAFAKIAASPITITLNIKKMITDAALGEGEDRTWLGKYMDWVKGVNKDYKAWVNDTNINALEWLETRNRATGWIAGGIRTMATAFSSDYRKSMKDYYERLNAQDDNTMGEGFPAETKGGKGNTGMDDGVDRLIYNARKFLEKARGELSVDVTSMGDTLAAKIKEQKEKIENEFSKWFIADNGKILFESEDFQKLKSAAPKIAQDLRNTFSELYKSAPALAKKQWEEKQNEKLVKSLDEVSKAYEKEVKSLHKAAIETIKARHEAEDYRLELDRLKSVMAIPVRTFWNAPEVDASEKRAGLAERYGDRINKARRERELLLEEMNSIERDGDGAVAPESMYQQLEYLDKLLKQLPESQKDAMKKLRDETSVTLGIIDQMWYNLAGSLKGDFATLFDDALRGELRSFADYVNSITNSIRQAFANMTANMLVNWMRVTGAQALGGFANLFSAADGGIIRGGSFVPLRAFAGGGIVSQPTLGLVGEGPDDEAIIPLKNGAVPVSMRGGRQNVKVEVINPPGTELKASDTRVRFNGQEMIVQVWLDAFNRNAHGLRTALGG
jgi:hypothetical protein